MATTKEDHTKSGLHDLEWSFGPTRLHAPRDDAVTMTRYASARGPRRTGKVVMVTKAVRTLWDEAISSKSGRRWLTPAAGGNIISRSSARRSRDVQSRSRSVRFKNLDWFVENQKNIYERYPNKWIAVAEDQIVGVADSAGELTRKVRSIGGKRVMFIKVSPEAWGRYK